MSRTRMIAGAAVLLGAVALAGGGANAIAGTRSSAVPSESLVQALGGNGVSNAELAAARGGTNLNLTTVTNTTTNTLNVGAASSGTVAGGDVVGSSTGKATAGIVNSQGIINQFTNTGSNVMMNSSMAIFINAQ